MRRLADLIRGMIPRRQQTVIASAPPEPPALPVEGATRRMTARFPHLLPLSAARDDFETWLVATHLREIAHGRDDGGLEPDEDLEALYLAVCELAGWEPQQGAEEPRGELRAAPAVIDLEQRDLGPLTLLPALAPRDAAARLVQWLRDSGRCDTYPAETIVTLHVEHAQCLGCEPTPSNTLLAAIKKLPGVECRKVVVGERQKVSGNRKERRMRGVEYTISPLAVDSDVPFDLPSRADLEAIRLAA